MKSATVLAIFGILVGSYMGGKITNTGVVEYQYAEVFDAAGECEEGQFMGGCSACKECQEYEYNGGGCSYFKNTLCVLCEPIPNCGTVSDEASGKLIPAVVFADGFDERCTLCENGYYGDDCKPCLVCDAGTYETVQCTQDNDTECAPCTECSDTQYLSRACTYTSDSECSDCTICTPGTYSEVVCQNMDTVYTETDDTVCTTCTECSDSEGMYVTKTCSITSDTKCTADERCDEGQYIGEVMDTGAWEVLGEKRECLECKTLRKSEYVQWKCDRDDHFNGQHQKCTECAKCNFDECDTSEMGEYESQTCTETSDTICPDCKAIDHCADGYVKCSGPDDSRCQQCKENFFGDDCCYLKSFSACGTMTTRERRANAFGYEGDTSEEFIAFCLEMCDEFPDCMAFEIKDDGVNTDESGDAILGTWGAKCMFKSAYTQLTDVPAFDCYSNICRQGELFMDFSKYDDMRIVAQAHALATSIGDPSLADYNGDILKKLEAYHAAKYGGGGQDGGLAANGEQQIAEFKALAGR